MSEDVFTDMIEDDFDSEYCACNFPLLDFEHQYFCYGCCLPIMRITPCPRCGYCGFIEDADMNLAGVCPECSGAGTLKSQRKAAVKDDEKPDGQAENVNVDLPDTAAQDSTSKSNSPAVSG